MLHYSIFNPNHVLKSSIISSYNTLSKLLSTLIWFYYLQTLQYILDVATLWTWLTSNLANKNKLSRHPHFFGFAVKMKEIVALPKCINDPLYYSWLLPLYLWASWWWACLRGPFVHFHDLPSIVVKVKSFLWAQIVMRYLVNYWVWN